MSSAAMGTLLKPMLRPSAAGLALVAGVLAQPVSAMGANRPAAAAATPPRRKTRREGNDTSWIVGLRLVFESSIVLKSLAMVLFGGMGVGPGTPNFLNVL